MGKNTLRISRLTLLSGIAACAMTIGFAAPNAQAAGFFLQEGSSSSAGASNAGAAAMPRDASVIFHNPSAITHLERAQVNGAVHFLYTHSKLEDQGTVIDPNGPFPPGPDTAANLGFTSDGGNPGGLQPLPNLYGAMPIGFDDRLWAGIGITAPFGLGPEYDEDFFGSFAVTEAELATIDATPTLAFKVNDMLSVGLSGIIQHGDLNYQLFTNINDYTRITADDVAYGYKASLTLTPNDKMIIGAQYRSGTNLDFEGDIEGAALLSVPALGTGARGTLNLPDIANFAVSYKWDDRWTIMGGIDWYGWSETDIATIVPQVSSNNLAVTFIYENTLNANLGFEYMYDDKWTFRAGYQYDETPTTAEGRSPLNPDGDRHWFSGGATQNIDDKWSVDYALTYIDIEDANINKTVGVSNVAAEGTESYAVIGTIGVNYKF